MNSGNRKRPYGITIAPITYDPGINDANELQTQTIHSGDPLKCDMIVQAEPPRKLAHLSAIPVLVVTSEAGYHSYYDHATVAYLKQAGVKVDHLDLPQAGVRGNGHFMFLEKNSAEIVDFVLKWVGKHE